MKNDTLTKNAQQQLESFVRRLENLEENKRDIADDMKEVFGEAKSCGFDVRQIRRLLKIRKIGVDDRREQDMILATYMHALGMAQPTLFDWTPDDKADAGSSERVETTISVDGGPAVPLETAKAALELVKAGVKRKAEPAKTKAVGRKPSQPPAGELNSKKRGVAASPPAPEHRKAASKGRIRGATVDLPKDNEAGR